MELSKTKFNLYSSLGNSKMRRKYSLFTVEGEKSVRDSLNVFTPVAVISSSNHKYEFISRDLPFYEVSESEMKLLSNLSTPSNIMAVYRLPANEYDNIADAVDRKNLYLMLDGIQDPGNLGTIIRTCHWFGIATIFASKDTVDVFNPKTIQATMGSFAKVRVIYCDLPQLLRIYDDMPIFGLLLDGENIYESQLASNGFIIMGNEGKGISEKLRESVTKKLLIPPVSSDHSESLNVAVATGITLSQFASKNKKLQ